MLVRIGEKKTKAAKSQSGWVQATNSRNQMVLESKLDLAQNTEQHQSFGYSAKPHLTLLTNERAILYITLPMVLLSFGFRPVGCLRSIRNMLVCPSPVISGSKTKTPDRHDTLASHCLGSFHILARKSNPTSWSCFIQALQLHSN